MTYRTATELLDDLRAGRASALELTDQAIARIEAKDGQVNAVVVRDFDRARDQARAADQARARGEDRALLGLPMTVKEALDVAGLPTTWGLPGAPPIPAADDAVVVARLRAAGAVILGKTNLPVMLADWQTANPVHGVTRNPYDLTRTPGGSSGGSAAALAAGYGALEFGSDLSSSLRAPAAFCGVHAHKPSFGIVPTRGFAPPGAPRDPDAPGIDLSVLGPMARSAADLELALDVTAGPDVREAAGWRLSLPPARHAALKDFRVLVLDRHPMIATAASVVDALAARAEALEQAGCRVGRASPLLPDLGEVGQTFITLLMAVFAADDPSSGRGTSHGDWIAADRRRGAIAARWRALFGEWDVVLCPSMPTVAFPLDDRPMDARTLDVDGVAAPYQAQPIWGSLATLTGNPATAMPIGRDAEGLPIGAQAVGPYLEDRTTLAFARAMEREFGGFVAPAGF
jgi:amidase